MPAMAQRSGRSQNPTLSVGDGLEMNRSDLAKIRNSSQDKNSEQLSVYLFAASFSPLDSVLYVSDVMNLDNVTINNRWFVQDRLEFERQFTSFIKADFPSESLYTSLFFSTKLSKMDKRRLKLIKRSTRKNGYELKEMWDFEFVVPVNQDI